MFSTGPDRVEVLPSACGFEGESLEIVVAGESKPLTIGVVYMKFSFDTADAAEIKDLAASGVLDGVPATDNGPRAFLDDWATTGRSIL